MVGRSESREANASGQNIARGIGIIRRRDGVSGVDVRAGDLAKRRFGFVSSAEPRELDRADLAQTSCPKIVEGRVARIFMKLGLEPTPDNHRRVLAILA